MKTTDEIHDMIQNGDCVADDGNIRHIYIILEHINNRLGALEATLQKAEKGNKRAADTASCLANGIQPD